MKKRLLFTLIIATLLMLCACEPSTDEPPGEKILPSGFDEAGFTTKYNTALESIKKGTKPETSAPTDAADTGFAVIPLDKKQFGIEAFAVLPIQERELTEEEFLQLAYGMDGVSADELLTRKYSDASVGRNNRDYTKLERNRQGFMLVQYCYENLRPKEEALEKESDGIPVYVRRPDKNGFVSYFWILPENLTDEGLLVIVDKEYKLANDPTLFIPPENLLQYEEIKPLIEQMAVKYGLSEHKPDKTYPLYHASSTTGGRWDVQLIYDDEYDFSVDVNPIDGSFISWARHPKGYFTKDTTPETTQTSDSKATEDEIFAVCEEYAKTYLTVEEAEILRTRVVDLGTKWGVELGIKMVGGETHSFIVSEKSGTLMIMSMKQGYTDFDSLP